MPSKRHDQTDAEWEKELLNWKNRYHNLFAGPQGKIVLTDMLQELNFFDEIITEGDRVRSNYAKRLLYLCGGWTADLAKRKE